jgi:hypothetical protein
MGSKRGPLGKAEKFYIQNNINNLDLDTLAKDLDRTVNAIRKYATKVAEEQIPTVSDQFARQSGAVIMTENASSMIDAKKKPTKKVRDSCVAKIKPEN